ncbi:MAG: hypothetical protein WA996_21725 [Candidatus Promineifilaceae bacterium]
MAYMADAGRPVVVDAHVVFFHQPRFAGMQPHAHPHPDPFGPGIPGHGPLYAGHSADGFSSFGEGGEEGVALGRDLLTVPAVDSLADDLVVAGQQISILISQLLQQPGRAFDIGEEKGDSTPGENGFGKDEFLVQSWFTPNW